MNAPAMPAAGEPAPVCRETIPLACARAFENLSSQQARLGEGQQMLAAKLDAVSRAVLGDGASRESLLARMERLESSTDTARQCGDRFWRVFAVLIALVSVVIAVLK
jgi:hypothetical protein